MPKNPPISTSPVAFRDPYAARSGGFFPRELFTKFGGLLVNMVRQDLRQRNAGSVLGTLWVFLSPLVYLAMYSLVYLFVFRANPAGVSPAAYVLRLFAGLVPFLAVSEGLSLGTQSIATNRSLLKVTVFPPALLPLKAVLTTVPAFAFSLTLVVVGCAIAGLLKPVALLLPVVIVMQFAFVAGVAWVLSLANFVVRDVSQLVVHALAVGMFASPIAYRVEMVPEALRFLVWFNPGTYFVLGYQSLLCEGHLPPTNVCIGIVVLGAGAFLLGHWVFHNVKFRLLGYA